jgi:alanine racemase
MPSFPGGGTVTCETGDVPGFRPAWVEVDLAALRQNVRMLRELAAPAEVMAVVKADGYGHGAVPVARAATEAGAAWLGVALVEEGVALRDAGLDAPIMVLSEPPIDAAPAVLASRLTPVVYTQAGIEALAKATSAAGWSEPLAVHLKIDTGMHRVGCSERDARVLADVIRECGELTLGGVLTHFAVADEPDNPYTALQLARFDAALDELSRAGVAPGVVHAANSAATLAFPAARRNLVRCGVAIYGIAPAPLFDGTLPLEPVMSFKARVSHIRKLDAGERVSYGLRYVLARPATVATVPVGYADGVPRALGHRGGEVLIRGRRHPIAGTITMDQLLVDVGDEEVEHGDEVVLLGRQGDEEITAAEWAQRLDTIGYEIVCGIGPRVPRGYR